MKNLIVVFVALMIFSAAHAALIDPSLKSFALLEGNEGTQRVLFLVKPEGNIPRPSRYDRPGVVHYYQEVTRQAVAPIIDEIQNNQLPGVKLLQVFWINGSVLADVTTQGLDALAHDAHVTKIYKNKRVGRDPVVGVKPGRRPTPFEDVPADYSFASIGLDKLFQEHPEINGNGVIVGIVDTGVDATHPALQGKVPLFYNGDTKSVSDPQDFDVHGTHVTGTIVGGDRKQNWIGVAPGAKAVMAGVVVQGFDVMLSGMQWFLDAEHNSVVANKVKVIGCSWNTGGAPDQEVFYRAIAAWEAAGILPVFSAGNAGSDGITPPHEYPGLEAVAAYGSDGLVADFSSRGPAKYQDKKVQKPDIAAPGVDINSSVPGGSYEQMSGTSMAQPHVTGTVALMLQVAPKLNPTQIRQILASTAQPGQGQTEGQWSPDYGFGKVSAYGAVKAAAQFESQLNGPSEMLSMMLETPSAIHFDELENATLGEVAGEVDQWPGTDSSQWLTPAQVYGK